MSYNEVTLKNIGNGAAVKKFEHELKNAFANCYDPNTDTKVGRKVTLTVVLTPDPKREKVGVIFKAESKLAADSAGEDHFVLVRDKANPGMPKAFVDDSEQLLIDDYGEDVRRINKDEEGNGN